jgi:hypothetical protein
MKFEHTKIFNFEGAFRGLRNPMDSWNKSDSNYLNCGGKIDYNTYVLGEKDLKLAQRMIKGGSEESKFLRSIIVSVDITAPRYWWSEFDTYKVGTVSNSCSTMHKLSAYPITLDMFEIDENNTEEAYWNIILGHLESLRQKYNQDKNYKWFRLLKQELPEGFLQRRTLTLNYAVLRNMYFQRRHHRLTCWNTIFVNWVESLPYSKELILFE